MHKKQLVAIAAALREHKPEYPYNSDERWDLWVDIVTEMADTCAEFNAMFSYTKFYEACGYERGDS